MKKFVSAILLSLVSVMGFAQQPQTSSAPVSSINAKYVQGVGTGYWPTKGSGLNLAVSAGTSYCFNAVFTYAGGTIAMTNNATNYVYLNSSCALTSNTTGFVTSTIPIATVVTSGGVITSIQDDRTMFSLTSTATSGVQYNDPTTTLYLIAASDSTVGDDGGALQRGTAVNLASWNVTSGVCTFNSTAAHNFQVNDWFTPDQAGVGGSGSWVRPATYGAWNTGVDLLQVASTPTSTQWTANCPLLANNSGSGGFAETANRFLHALVMQEPFFNGHGNIVVRSPYEGDFIPFWLSEYNTIYHPIFTNWQTAHPGGKMYAFWTGGRNDMQACTSLSTLESDMLQWAALAHADGAVVVANTITPNPWNTTNLGCHTAFVNMAQLNAWMKLQRKTDANTSPRCTTQCGQYIDYVVEADAEINDLQDLNEYTAGGSITTNAQTLIADMMNSALSSQASFATAQHGPYSVSGVYGGTISPGFGTAYIPKANTSYNFSWWDAAGSNNLLRIDATSVALPYLSNSGCLGTNSSGAFTSIGCGNGVFPATNGVLKNTSTSATATATQQDITAPYNCFDTSGSGTAQTCNTSPTFTPVSGDKINYRTTTTNTGDVTIVVNGAAAKHVKKWSGAAVLVAGDLVANVPVTMTYDGNFWEISTIGNAPATSSCGASNIPCTNTANTYTTGVQTIQTGVPNGVGLVVKGTTGPIPAILVQSNSNSGNASVAFPSPVTAGNDIVVFCSSGGFNHSHPIPFDSLGNTYTNIATWDGSFSQGGNTVAMTFSASGGADTVNCNGSGSPIIFEYSGLAHSSFVDVTNIAVGASSPAALSVTTTTSDLILAGVVTNAGSTFNSPSITGVGYTFQQSSGTVGNYDGYIWGNTVGVGAQNVTISWNSNGGNSTSYAPFMIALKTFGSSPQTADLQQNQGATGTVLSAFDANGNFRGAVGSNEVVTFSATPTFSVAKRSSQITMTGDITGITIGSGIDGQEKTLCFIQDATGGRNVTAWPSNIVGGYLVSVAPNAVNCIHLTFLSSTSTWYSDAPINLGQNGPGTFGKYIFHFKSTPVTLPNSQVAFESVETFTMASSTYFGISFGLNRVSTSDTIGFAIGQNSSSCYYNYAVQNDGNQVLYKVTSGGVSTSVGASGASGTRDYTGDYAAFFVYQSDSQVANQFTWGLQGHNSTSTSATDSSCSMTTPMHVYMYAPTYAQIKGAAMAYPWTVF